MEPSALAVQNPWWVNAKEIEADGKVREALSKEKKIIYTLDFDKNLIILGPRQVGKSTQLKLFVYDLITNKHIDARNILYFSCEPLRDKKEMIEIMTTFLEISREIKGKKYIFFDEATIVKEWEYSLKYFLETLRKDEQIIVSGSNAMLLKKGFERLPGRKVETKLFLPLSFRDFLLNFASQPLKDSLIKNYFVYKDINNVKNIYSLALRMLPFLPELNSKLLVYLKTGGFLKAIYEFFENSKIKEETYESYVSWILGDLSKLDKRESIFKSMTAGIVKKYTSKFSLLSFAREMEIPSHVTVSEYLELLQSLLLINNLYQVALDKKLPILRKERKCYFLDPFLYSVFTGYSFGKYGDYSSNNEDKIIEGVVCETLARFNRTNLDVNHFLWYFFGKGETDFVVKFDNSVTGIEVKWQEKTDKRDFKNFYSFKEKILLSKKYLAIEDNFLIVPTSIFLALART